MEECSPPTQSIISPGSACPPAEPSIPMTTGKTILRSGGISSFPSAPLARSRRIHHPSHRSRQIARPHPAGRLIDLFQPVNQIPDFAARIRPARRRAEMRPAPERPAIVNLASPAASEKRARSVIRNDQRIAPCRAPGGHHHQRLAVRQIRRAPGQPEPTTIGDSRAIPHHRTR
jgi:hypothetical protein